MKRSWTITTLASLALAVTVGVTGCAAIRRSQARDTEQFLAAAGFTVQLAGTAEQQHLTAMPPYRLLSHASGDGVEYTYADPKNCGCVYVGGPREYSEYRRLVTERQLAQEQLWAEESWRWGARRPWW